MPAGESAGRRLRRRVGGDDQRRDDEERGERPTMDGHVMDAASSSKQDHETRRKSLRDLRTRHIVFASHICAAVFLRCETLSSRTKRGTCTGPTSSALADARADTTPIQAG
jgi:hypothetical protein